MTLEGPLGACGKNSIMATFISANNIRAKKVQANALVGPLTGNVVGNFTGTITNSQIFPPVASYNGVAAKAIAPTAYFALLTKATAGVDYTLAAPGAANVGHQIAVYATASAAHVVTVTGLAGGTTMTFTAGVGNGFVLFAVDAATWSIVTVTNVTQS
jgi:hypothetical protein